MECGSRSGRYPIATVAQSARGGDATVQAQVESIKSAIIAQEKFLGELVEHASRWEMSGGEVRLFFPTESRALAEMLQARDPMERLRNVASRILGHTVRVCVKLEAVPVGGEQHPTARGNCAPSSSKIRSCARCWNDSAARFPT